MMAADCRKDSGTVVRYPSLKAEQSLYEANFCDFGFCWRGTYHKKRGILYMESYGLLGQAASNYRKIMKKDGWGGRIRTYDTRYQKPLPYHLATPQR